MDQGLRGTRLHDDRPGVDVNVQDFAHIKLPLRIMFNVKILQLLSPPRTRRPKRPLCPDRIGRPRHCNLRDQSKRLGPHARLVEIIGHFQQKSHTAGFSGPTPSAQSNVGLPVVFRLLLGGRCIGGSRWWEEGPHGGLAMGGPAVVVEIRLVVGQAIIYS